MASEEVSAANDTASQAGGSGVGMSDDYSSGEVSNMNISVLVDAKQEYSRQLVQLIRPHFLSGIMSIYEEAQSMCQEANEEDLCMLTFQELLSQVPKWSKVLVEQEK